MPGAAPGGRKTARAILSATWLPDKACISSGSLVGNIAPLSSAALPGRSCKYDNIQETNYLHSELISVSQQGSAVTLLGLEMLLFG